MFLRESSRVLDLRIMVIKQYAVWKAFSHFGTYIVGTRQEIYATSALDCARRVAPGTRMKNTWQEYRVSFSTTPENLAEELMAVAGSLPGVCGCEQTGVAGETIRPQWRVYLDEEADGAEFRVQFLECALTFGIPDATLDGPHRLERQNWHDGWREYFKPVMLGQRLAIIPAWDNAAARTAEEEGRLTLRLEPGMAFGTGTHATTQLCLILAEEELQPGTRVLDIGTGSGVLAIAAIKLGADECVAVDTDPEVQENLQENLRLNNISPEKVRLVIGPLDQTDPGPYGFIFCNMLLHEFTPLLPHLPGRVASGGVLLLSGLLATEHEQVMQSLANLPFSIERIRHSGEWEAIVAKRL